MELLWNQKTALETRPLSHWAESKSQTYIGRRPRPLSCWYFISELPVPTSYRSDYSSCSLQPECSQVSGMCFALYVVLLGRKLCDLHSHGCFLC